MDGKPEILLDPNTLSDDGTVALSMYSVSEEAKYLAYGVSSSGSDWVTIKVMRIEDKTVEPDTISWVKIANLKIQRGFLLFILRQNYFRYIILHRVVSCYLFFM